MMITKVSFPRLAEAVIALATALAMPTVAAATTVTPVLIDLQSSGRSVVSNISVTNTGANPLPTEIVIQRLDPTVTGLVAGKGETDDLLVAPPTALIPAGQTQTFRVQWIGDAELAASRHYFVSINQLPVKLPEGQSAVQVVYNFQVLVSVSTPGKTPSLAIKSAVIGDHDGRPAPSLSIENSGSAHGYLSQRRIKIVETSPSGTEIFAKTLGGAEFQQLVGYGLIASGQTRTILLPVDLPSRTGHITATLLDGSGQ